MPLFARAVALAGSDGVGAEGERRYPGGRRDRRVEPGRTAMRRVRLEPESIAFDDLRLGPQIQCPAEQCGDVLARDRSGNWTYQFAVVVDDLAQGVDVVIRGEDLLTSTGRQIQLGGLLGCWRASSTMRCSSIPTAASSASRAATPDLPSCGRPGGARVVLLARRPGSPASSLRERASRRPISRACSLW